MKRLLFILALFLVSCSAEETPEQQELQKPEFAIFISNECPSNNSLTVYMYKEEFEKHFIYVRSKRDECIYLEVTSWDNKEHSGYWAGLITPEDYEYPSTF